MPSTVPNSPMKGVTEAVVASQFMLRSSLASSSLTPICSVRSSAARFFTVPLAFTCRSISSYPKSNTDTKGDGRNCSLATITDSRPLDFRKARKKRELERRAPRSACHFEKITVHEKIEKHTRMASTTMPRGPLCWTISQMFNCRRKAKKAWPVNSSPNHKSNTIDGNPLGKNGPIDGTIPADAEEPAAHAG